MTENTNTAQAIEKKIALKTYENTSQTLEENKEQTQEANTAQATEKKTALTTDENTVQTLAEKTKQTQIQRWL